MLINDVHDLCQPRQRLLATATRHPSEISAPALTYCARYYCKL